MNSELCGYLIGGACFVVGVAVFVWMVVTTPPPPDDKHDDAG